MNNLSVFQFESQEVEIVLINDNPWFNASQVTRILRLHPDAAAIVSERRILLSFAECLGLISKHPNMDFAIFLKNIVIDLTLPIEWKNLYANQFSSFVKGWVADVAKFEKEECQQQVFAKTASEYESLKGLAIVGQPSSQSREGKTPDFVFADDKGIVVAVGEFKVNQFTKADLKQLRGYMTVFEVKLGFAIAPELVKSLHNLPPDIKFIKCNQPDFEAYRLRQLIDSYFAA
jgi:hypothetical protein